MFCRLYLLITLTYLTCFLGFAHTPTEINYNIIINDTNQTLTIHFTEQGAFDLIHKIRPETKTDSIIHLNNYIEDFKNYFSANIKLKLNDKYINLIYKTSNLNAHDATFSFELNNLPKTISKGEVKLHSFIDVYKRTKYYVTLSINNTAQKELLNKTHTTYSFEISDFQRTKNKSNLLHYLGIILLLMTIIIYIVQKRKSTKNNS